MTKTSAPIRVISVMLAIVLAVTLIPTAALPQAYAEPANDAVQDQAADMTDAEADATTADDEAAEAADQEASASEAAETSRPAVTSATERISEGAPGSSPAATVEMTRASVTLSRDADAVVPTIISQAHMSFQVNPEAAGEATLIGVEPGADIATLTIPQSIVSAGTVYTITNICSMGGGVRASKQ